MEKMKKYRQLWLVLPIVVCLGVIMYGGINYLGELRANLTEQAIDNVLAVTRQQQQGFDNFIAMDRERLHSYADYFSKHKDSGADAAKEMLSLFDDVKAVLAVSCLDSQEAGGAWVATSNADYKPKTLDLETEAEYSALGGSGVRSSYISVVTEKNMFGYYETFTFPNGHRGIIQLSYEIETFTEAFSLSFYDGQGLGFVVNQEGDILLRSAGMMGDHLYGNIFEIINGTRVDQADVDRFAQSLIDRESGTLTYEGERGTYVYAYVPIEAVDDWFLVSVVRLDAIANETTKILMSSQQALMLLAALLVVIAVFGIAIWATNSALRKRDNEIGYQAALINIFSTYLARNTDNVFMLLDVQTNKLDYISPNVERVLGVATDQMMEDVNSFRPAHKIEDPSEDYLAYLRELEPGTEVEDIYLEWVNPKTQEQLWLLESAYCTLVQGHKKLVFYISDRTRDRRTQDHLTEALQMAKAANEAKSAFLGNVSHDIRTPMNAIIGFTTLLKEETDNPAMVQEYAGRIETASQHLLSLINDVLDINKIESGSTSLNFVEMDLAEVIDEINAIIRPQAKAKDQTFDIHVSPLNYEHLQGDKLRINQILINLLSNSVKYTPAGGRIEMRVEELPQRIKKHSHVRFTVSDNGMGMSEEYLKVIFDPFTREETEATYEIQGTGLGMAITKSLVDLMGGSIKVESKLGEGSAFTVELDLQIQEQEDDPQFWADSGIKRMLVADDEEDACQAIVRLMSETGVEVNYVANGEDAFHRLCFAREAGNPYDVVLLDWKMPRMNGLEAARLIREEYPEDIPILLLTAYDWSDIEQEAAELGIRYFMPKPFFISTFRNAVGRITEEAKKKKAEEANDDVVKDKHVLVVDDIEVNRMILVKILAMLGATCDTADNGQKAVEAFEKSRPGEYDLILMDVQMPVLDGYGATRAIRASEHPSAKMVPIIAMTANAFVDDVRNAIDSGMDAHIAKPIQVDNMKTTLAQVFARRAEKAK